MDRIRRACNRKLVFETKAEAEANAKAASDSAGMQLYPYQCAACFKWHLTKKLLNIKVSPPPQDILDYWKKKDE